MKVECIVDHDIACILVSTLLVKENILHHSSLKKESCILDVYLFDLVCVCRFKIRSITSNDSCFYCIINVTNLEDSMITTMATMMMMIFSKLTVLSKYHYLLGLYHLDGQLVGSSEIIFSNG